MFKWYSKFGIIKSEIYYQGIKVGYLSYSENKNWSEEVNVHIYPEHKSEELLKEIENFREFIQGFKFILGIKATTDYFYTKVK